MNALKTHLPALLYGWFWVGLALSGWFAPQHRVTELGSDWVTKGWHLSLMALIFGGVTLGFYLWRMRANSGD